MGTYNVVTEILHNSDVPVWAFEILSLKFSTLLSAVKKYSIVMCVLIRIL